MAEDNDGMPVFVLRLNACQRKLAKVSLLHPSPVTEDEERRKSSFNLLMGGKQKGSSSRGQVVINCVFPDVKDAKQAGLNSESERRLEVLGLSFRRLCWTNCNGKSRSRFYSVSF